MNRFWKPSYKPPAGSKIDQNHPLADHCVAAYLFNDNSSGIALDASVYQNHGVLKNGAYISNNKLFLDGTDDYVEVPHSPSLNLPNAITVIARLNSTDIQSRWNDIVGKGTTDADESFSFYYINGQIWMELGDPYTAYSISFSNSITYQHSYSMTKTSTSYSAAYYLNNWSYNLWQIGNQGLNIRYNTLPMSIGKRFYNSTFAQRSMNFKGFMEYLYIFNRELSKAEVTDFFENPYGIIEVPSAIKYFANLRNQIKTPSILSQESLGLPRFPGKINIGASSITSSESFGSNKFINSKAPNNKSVSTLSFDSNLDTCLLIPISYPNNITVNVFGTTGSTSYSYKISSCNKDGESLPSSAITTNIGNQTLNTSNFNRISWELYDNAEYYKIYKLVESQYKLIFVARDINHLDDIGYITLNENPKTSTTLGYNPYKLNLGPYIKLYTDSIDKTKNYLSVLSNIPISSYQQIAIGQWMPRVFNFSNDLVWIFASQSTSSNYNQIILHEFNRKTGDKSQKGRVYINRTNAYFDDQFDVTVDRHSTGTASATTSTVTGTNTLWVTNKIAAGARIGFGSTDASLIKTWYQITAIASNTSLTIAEVLLTNIPSNTPYIIEEIRVIQTYNQTNNAATNNGIFITKGLNYNYFDLNTAAVNMATTVDNIRANYHISDAASSTLNNISFAILAPRIDFNTQYMYVFATTTGTTGNIYKFNIRASLTGLSSGRTTSGYLYKSALYTYPQSILGRDYRVGTYAITKHGPGKDIPCLYFHWSQNIYRIPEHTINDSKSFEMDYMTLISPYNDETTGMNSVRDIAYDPKLDIFIGGRYQSWRATERGELFQYNLTNSRSIAQIGIYGFYFPYKDSLDESINPDAYSFMRTQTYKYHVFSDGILFKADNNTISLEYVGCDILYADQTSSYAITPIISCPNATSFDKLYVSYDEFSGDFERIVVSDNFRIFARTTGIIDNSGAWTQILDNNISNLVASDKIQFKIVFRTIGGSGLIAKIKNISVQYKTSNFIDDDFKIDSINTASNANTLYLNQINITNTLPYTINIYNDDNLYAQQSSELTTYGTLQSYVDNLWTTGKISDKSLFKKSISNINAKPSSLKRTYNRSFYFNGSSYIQSPNSQDFNFNGDFTIQFYYKPFNLSSFGGSNFRILSFGGRDRSSGWEIGKETISSVDKLVFFIGNTSTNTRIEICNISELANDWNKITVVRKNNQIATYLNITRKSLISNSSTISNNTNTLNIGCGNESNSIYFMNGYLTNLLILKGYGLVKSVESVISPPPFTVTGFRIDTYTNNWTTDFTFFKGKTPLTTTYDSDIFESTLENTSYMLTGYVFSYMPIKAKLQIVCNNSTVVYVGNNALENNYNSSNYLMYSTNQITEITLNAGYTPFRILYGNSVGTGYLRFYLNDSTNWSGYIYGDSIPSSIDNYVYNDSEYDTWNNIRTNPLSKYCVLHLNFEDETNLPNIPKRFVFNNGVLDSLNKVKIKLS
jgi:hypothetical protein